MVSLWSLSHENPQTIAAWNAQLDKLGCAPRPAKADEATPGPSTSGKSVMCPAQTTGRCTATEADIADLRAAQAYEAQVVHDTCSAPAPPPAPSAVRPRAPGQRDIVNITEEIAVHDAPPLPQATRCVIEWLLRYLSPSLDLQMINRSIIGITNFSGSCAYCSCNRPIVMMLLHRSAGLLLLFWALVVQFLASGRRRNWLCHRSSGGSSWTRPLATSAGSRSKIR